MTEDHVQQIEEWDPEDAQNKLNAKRLKMPVEFIRNDTECPDMRLDVSEPRERQRAQTTPKIVSNGKNKNALL